MRILIRTDASDRIGTGHVMRCLALARKLKADGHEPEFACRSLPGNLIGRIRAWGFPVHALPAGRDVPEPAGASLPPHAAWVGASWEQDAEEVSKVLVSPAGEAPVDGLLVDQYGLDAAWESALRPLVGWVGVLDDLADRPHACDLLLDQNLHDGPERRYAGLVAASCRLLLGPEYALLREEFAPARAALRRDSVSVRRILIYFGGTDPGDDIRKALEAVSLAGWEGRAVDVVVPEGHPRERELAERCAGKPGFVLHGHVATMSALMAAADLAIGAGGTASWERCCLGLPCIALCIADNQEGLLKGLHGIGAATYLGRSRDVSAADLAEALRRLDRDPERLRRMSGAASSLVDGEGAARVAAAVAGLAGRRNASAGPPGAEPRLRKAVPGDAAAYFAWVNDPETRRHAFESARIGWPEHLAWFRSKLADAASRLYVLEIEGRPAGQIRFEMTAAGAEIDYSLAPEFRGRGFGAALLRLGTAELQAEQARAVDFIGYVKPENLASAKAFQRAGFEQMPPGNVKGNPCRVFGKTNCGR